MDRPHHSARALSALSQPIDVVKQASTAAHQHSSVVLHSLPATRPPTSRGSSAPFTQHPMTTGGTPRSPHQRHGYHSSDPSVLQHQYAKPITYGAAHGTGYTHHITSRAEPVPIGNRDIIVGPAEERSSSSPTAGAASKLLLSVKRTFSIKKVQPQPSAPPVSFMYEFESPRPPTPPEIHQIATGTKSPLPLLRRTKTGPSRVSLPPPAHSALKKTSTLSSETSSTASGSTGPLTPESGSRSGSSMGGPVDQPRLWKNKTMLARLLGGKRNKNGGSGDGGFLASDESARSVTPPARKNVRFLNENDHT